MDLRKKWMSVRDRTADFIVNEGLEKFPGGASVHPVPGNDRLLMVAHHPGGKGLDWTLAEFSEMDVPELGVLENPANTGPWVCTLKELMPPQHHDAGILNTFLFRNPAQVRTAVEASCAFSWEMFDELLPLLATADDTIVVVGITTFRDVIGRWRGELQRRGMEFEPVLMEKTEECSAGSRTVSIFYEGPAVLGKLKVAGVVNIKILAVLDTNPRCINCLGSDKVPRIKEDLRLFLAEHLA